MSHCSGSKQRPKPEHTQFRVGHEPLRNTELRTFVALEVILPIILSTNQLAGLAFPTFKSFLFKQWNTLLCKDQKQNVFHFYKRVKTLNTSVTHGPKSRSQTARHQLMLRGRLSCIFSRKGKENLRSHIWENQMYEMEISELLSAL